MHRIQARSDHGRSDAASDRIDRSSGMSASDRTTASARRPSLPCRPIARTTSVNAISLDEASGILLDCGDEFGGSASGTTSFTIADESRYSTRYDDLPAVRRALGSARSDTRPSRRQEGHQVATRGGDPADAISRVIARSVAGNGARTATGRPCSVTSSRSPCSTRRRYLLRFWRSSRTPTCLVSM